MIKHILLLLCLLSLSRADRTHFTVALPSMNTKLLSNWALEISDPNSMFYGQYMSIDEINTATEPPASIYQPVLDWLKRGGIQTERNGDSISCFGFIEDIERLLNVEMYYHKERGHYHSVNSYIIPDYLTDKIVFIDGISNPLLPKMKVKMGQDKVFYVSREVVNRLYNITDPTLKHSSSVGAAEFLNGNGFLIEGIKQTQYENDITIDTDIKVVGNTNFNLSLETNLDLQMFAQTLQLDKGEIWYWGTQSWMYSFAIELLQSKNVPQVISMSWGWAEDQQCTIAPCSDTDSEQYITRTNIEFLKIALRGLTLLAASGDAGAPGRTSEGCTSTRPLNPIFPGASPWVTSVGATYVSDNAPQTTWKTRFCQEHACANGKTQRSCNYAEIQWTSGGGFGMYPSIEVPPWQKNETMKYLLSGVPLPASYSYDFLGRGYPDVVVNGHNCPIWTYSSLIAGDGTSCAAPLFAAMIALINDHQVAHGRPKVGFINPLLYSMYRHDPSTFTDITTGNNWCTEMECCPTRSSGGSNFGFEASKGWDPVSGIGYPNMGRILSWLDSNT